MVVVDEREGHDGLFRPGVGVRCCGLAVRRKRSRRGQRSDGLPEQLIPISAHLIIAHASGDWFGPPNTIETQHAAKNAGADVLDADVRTTRDGTLVASRDDGITINAEHTVSIAKTDYATLHSVDLGNTWPGPKDDYPLAGHHVAVPTIEAMLRTFAHVPFGLEFKNNR